MLIVIFQITIYFLKKHFKYHEEKVTGCSDRVRQSKFVLSELSYIKKISSLVESGLKKT